MYFNHIRFKNNFNLFYSIYSRRPPPQKIEVIGRIIKKVSPPIYENSRKLFSIVYSLFFRKRKVETKGDIIKIFFGSEHVKPNMKDCDWAFGSYFEEEIKNKRYMRIPLCVVMDYNINRFGIFLRKKKFDFKKIRKEKKNFCIFLYSQDVKSRNNFYRKLSKYKKIDSPGRCMNNMPSISKKNAKESRLSKDWIHEKLNFINKYKFTIAYENFFSPGWVTEKLTHPLLVRSIPIYVGHKDVKKEFNTKSFINYHDFNNMDDFINYIIKVDNDKELYKKILEEPIFKNNKLPKNFDLKRIERRFKEIFE